MPELIEELAKIIWSLRLIDIAKLARRYGFTKNEIVYLAWDALPESIQDHIRGVARAGSKSRH